MIKIKPGIIIAFIMLAVLAGCSKLEKDKTTKISAEAEIVSQLGQKVILSYADEQLEVPVSNEFLNEHKLGDSVNVTLMHHKLPSTDGHYYEFISFNGEEAVS